MAAQFNLRSGYASLENDFSRPEICTYLPFINEQHSNLCDTRYAWAIKEPISPNNSVMVAGFDVPVKRYTDKTLIRNRI